MFLAGGNAGVVDRLQPVLSSLSDIIRRYDTAPLASNRQAGDQPVAAVGGGRPGRVVCRWPLGGLSDDQLRDLLGTGPMVAPGLKNRFEDVLTGSQEGWWTTVLGAKDAGLALDIARGADVELPAARVVQQLYDKAAASGLDDADIAAVTELYRGAATTVLR